MLTNDKMPAITDWLNELPGSLLNDMEQEQISDFLAHIFGDHLVQMGGLSDLSLVKSSPIPHKVYVSDGPNLPSKPSGIPTCIQADFVELPFQPNSIDVVVLSHLLEFMAEPKVVLKELHQMLIPNGLVLILGFNPLSFWGLRKLIMKQQGYPWQSSHFWSITRVKHWLHSIGFRFVMQKTFCFRPPLKNAERLRQLLYIEPIGQISAPILGGAYLIIAQKRVYGMTTWKKDWYQQEVSLSTGDIYHAHR